MDDLKKLKSTAKGFSILYVEDNEALRKNATGLLHKFFDDVVVAEDGAVALEMFKNKHYPIVITDIKMPKMNGFKLTQNIKKIQTNTKVIVMSGFDEKEYLLKAIELGIFRYLKKPVNVTELTNVLYEALQEIKQEQHSQLLLTHLKSIFNYQSSMVLMLNATRSIIANQMFYDFFNVDSVEEFRETYGDVSTTFLEHDGFLYNNQEENSLDKLRLNEKKLFHIKMKNQKSEIKHLIVKYQIIPEKDGYGILSFDDITELKLLKLFDEKQTNIDEEEHDTQAMFDLLKVIQRNSAKVHLHNYYKGLSITNDGVITDTENGTLTLKTNYLQEKAIQYAGSTILVSEALPYALECSSIVKLKFENQSVEMKNLKFIKSSPVSRKTIRVFPEEKHTVSLFLGENKFHGDVSIEDISLDAVKLKLNALPAGLQKGDEVNLDLVLELNKRPLIINEKATMYRKSESRHSFSVVFMFKKSQKGDLVKYITKRQMAVIREFKGLQNG